MTNPRLILLIAALTAHGALAPNARAQSDETPPSDPPPAEETPAEPADDAPPPEQQPAPEQPSEEPGEAEDDEALPSLDDLLDLEDPAAETPDEVGAEELEKALSGDQSQGEPFVQAVALMDKAAVRIEDDDDLSLATQRIQQDAIDKLEKMIQQAKESQQQQSSSSSSSQNQDQQQTPDQQNKSQQQQQTNAQGENNAELIPPGAENPELNPVVAAARAAWGSLPERVRDALVQGSSEQFSSLYRGLTEEYYQRLAEEPD